METKAVTQVQRSMGYGSVYLLGTIKSILQQYSIQELNYCKGSLFLDGNEFSLYGFNSVFYKIIYINYNQTLKGASIWLGIGINYRSNRKADQAEALDSHQG
jgi:hypothetical protein